MSFTVDSRGESSQEQLFPGQGRDLRAHFLRTYLLFTAVILAVTWLFASLARNWLEQDVARRDRALAHALAGQITSLIPDPDAAATLDSWLAIAGLEEASLVLVVSADGQTVLRHERGISLPPGADWARWQRDAVNVALRTPAGFFTSLDPGRGEWLHAFATAPADDLRLLIMRPARVAYAPWERFGQGVMVAIVIYLAGGLFYWLLLSRQVITPLQQLDIFSGLVRWRGQLRPAEMAQLTRLARRPDQIGSLAHSLIAMVRDIEKRFVQLSTLLETARVVASSLDVSEVLNSILDQVQELFHVERCAIVVLDRRADLFRIRASHGLSQEYVRHLSIAPSEPHSPSMRALRNRVPIQVSDSETDLAFAAFRPRARVEGYRSVLAIPLFTQHAPPAVLLLYKAEPYRYSYSELELASSFGNHVSIAMENAALYARSDERLREQTRRLEAIVESLDDGLILEGMTEEVLYCNRRALAWVGLSRREARRQTSAQLMQRLIAQAVDPVAAQQTVTAALAGPEPRSFELALGEDDGRFRDLRVQMFNVTDDQGRPLGRGQLWQDVTRDRELDRMKSALLSTVSHELRTPLATIKGFATTLLASDVQWDAGAQREFLETISQETDRLTRLVKNLLDMSRIEAGMLEMHCGLHSLNDLLAQVVQAFRPALGPRLQLRLDDALPIAWIDPSRVGTVIRNLLENAVKYSPPGGVIELTTWHQNGRVFLSVRDHGPGVPADLQDKIFDRFYRVDDQRTRQVGGAGLGLAICKGFVEAHHGRVWVESGDPGACFGFSLPVEQAGHGPGRQRQVETRLPEAR